MLQKKQRIHCDEKNIATYQKLRHDDALVHTEGILNYLEQDNESLLAEK